MKQISRYIQPAELKISLPKNQNIEIQHLLLGYSEEQYSYVTPVSTDFNGRVSGGGTAYKNYKAYDFGFSVANKSNVAMRISIHLIKVDEDGYTISDHYVWGDVNGGEKRRMWAGFKFSKVRDFLQYKIKSVNIGQTPANRNEGARWTDSTHPNYTLYHAIEADKFEDNRSKGWLALLVLALLTLFFLAGQCS